MRRGAQHSHGEGDHGEPQRAKRARQEPDRSSGGAKADVSTYRSDFDDRLLEVFLRGFLRLVSISKRDVDRTTLVIAELSDAMRSKNMQAEVYGSARTGIVLPCSDLDFLVFPVRSGDPTSSSADPVNRARSATLSRAGYPQHQQATPAVRRMPLAMHLNKRERNAAVSSQIHSVVHALQNDRRFTRIRKILHATVPIVKCLHRSTNCEVDLSFTPDGIDSSEYIIRQLLAPNCVLARGLIILVKALLAEWKLNDPSCGGLGSFPVALMVFWFIHSEGVHYEPNLQYSYAVNLLGFLKYYGDDFDYKNLAIDLGRMTTFKKFATSEFTIMNPLDPTRNAAKACARFGSEVRRKFHDAYASLINYSLAANDNGVRANMTLASIKRMFSSTLYAVDRDGSALQDVMAARDHGAVEQQWTDQHVYVGGNVFCATLLSD